MRPTLGASGVSTDGVETAGSGSANPTFGEGESSLMKKICSVAFTVVTSCLATQGFAQTARHVVVHAGHVLDVKSGKILADQTLVIEDGKILSAGATVEPKVPADALRIDLPNATVLPGLIDA